MPIDYCNAKMTKWYSLSFYIHMSVMQSKIIDVDKCYWAAHIRKRKRKSWPRKWLQWLLPDSHHWYLPYSSVGSTDFTALLYLCFSKPFIRRSWRSPELTPDRHLDLKILCRHFYDIVPTSCWGFLVPYCLSPASPVPAYIIEIYLRGQQTERVD